MCVGVAVALAGQMAGFGTPAAASNDGVLMALQGPPQGRGGPGPGAPWEWWNDAEVQKELGLTADKVKQINDIYVRRNSELRPIAHEHQKAWSELDKMTRERVVDESTYQMQVMRVEQARARLSESRTVMLYRMYRTLSPEQHQKLQDIFARRAERSNSRERSSSPGR